MVEGRFPACWPDLFVAGRPPLSLRDISPLKGGRGESEDLHQSPQGGEGGVGGYAPVSRRPGSALLRERHTEAEGRTDAGRTAQRDRASVDLGDVPDDCQSEAGAAARLPGAVHPIEALKDA